ncbi:MAG: cell division protein ZapA [Paracoccaceae bacterium]
MPEVTIAIGGREFEVACQLGEEAYLHTAAKMLDDEAQVLSDQVGRMPEARMLLMAGLMLADRTASMEDKVAEVEARIAERDAEIAVLKERAPETVEVPVEVPVVPESVTDSLAVIADHAEALALVVEAKSA